MTLLRLGPACLGGERPAEVARIVEAIVSAGRRRRSLPWCCSSAVRAGGRTKAVAPRPVRARFDAGEARHAASRRRTAASMNRRPSRALAHGPAAEVGANASRSLAAAAPPREVPTRVSVGRRDGQRVVDSRGDATVRRRDRDDRCSSGAAPVAQTPRFVTGKEGSPADAGVRLDCQPAGCLGASILAGFVGSIR